MWAYIYIYKLGNTHSFTHTYSLYLHVFKTEKKKAKKKAMRFIHDSPNKFLPRPAYVSELLPEKYRKSNYYSCNIIQNLWISH